MKKNTVALFGLHRERRKYFNCLLVSLDASDGLTVTLNSYGRFIFWHTYVSICEVSHW